MAEDTKARLPAGGQAWVHYFGDDLPEGLDEPKTLLGGKGASLHVMTCAGLNVPPGFTISTEACRRFFEHGDRWPPELERQIRACLARLERDMGRAFGRGKEPLFVSVRSGAAVSMPGMMDTILNCGLHPGLAEELGDTPHFWHLYIQFITMFARVVAGIEPERFESSLGGAEADRDLAFKYLALYEESAGRPFPTDPWQALLECINAVFGSWNNERAIAYRRRNDIRGLAGTAVNVQAMFPSRVSGILFTQDPNDLATNRMVLEASWGLGEAIVSGDVTPDRFMVDREDFGRFETFLGDKVARWRRRATRATTTRTPSASPPSRCGKSPS